MSDLKTVGECSMLMDVLKFKYEWKIRKFSTYIGKLSEYKSEKFLLSDSTWFLTVVPNYQGSYFVSLSLHRDSKGYPVTAEINFGIKTANRIILNEKKASRTFSNEKPVWACLKFLREDNLLRKKSDWMPSDILTIICSIEIKNTPVLQTRYRQLSEDLKNLFHSKENADVVLNVREQTYLVHKSFLVARSPVFAAMFRHNMEEKLTGRVDISDCDPEAFSVFLIFLYSGTVDFTKCNICELYKITDKYDVLELKLMCKDFMIRTLSLQNFCQILVVCVQLNDAELLVEVERYFCENFCKIVSSENWESLLESNSRPANDFLKNIAPKLHFIHFY